MHYKQGICGTHRIDLAFSLRKPLVISARWDEIQRAVCAYQVSMDTAGFTNVWREFLFFYFFYYLFSPWNRNRQLKPHQASCSGFYQVFHCVTCGFLSTSPSNHLSTLPVSSPPESCLHALIACLDCTALCSSLGAFQASCSCLAGPVLLAASHVLSCMPILFQYPVARLSLFVFSEGKKK